MLPNWVPTPARRRFKQSKTLLPFLPSLDLRTAMDVLYDLATSLVDDPARFGDPDDVLCWGFTLPPDLDPGAMADHRQVALAALLDEWPWIQTILPVDRGSVRIAGA